MTSLDRALTEQGLVVTVPIDVRRFDFGSVGDRLTFPSPGHEVTPVVCPVRAVRMLRVESYVERAPVAELAAVVRTVWVQTTGEWGYLQRHLPTGGVEIHWRLGDEPRLLGPLTGPQLEVLPPRSTVLGVRFLPGAGPSLTDALEGIVDRSIELRSLWGCSAVERLGDAITTAATPHQAIAILEAELVRRRRLVSGADPVISEAVAVLMPWHPVAVGTVASHLSLSVSQLRRRCVQAVGIGPKSLQRTLRFQAFLALAQAGAVASGKRGADGVAGLAVDVGYSDQAHLSRECLRLAGITPTQLLGGALERCACGHDHAASYRPFLASRGRRPVPR